MRRRQDRRHEDLVGGDGNRWSLPLPTRSKGRRRMEYDPTRRGAILPSNLSQQAPAQTGAPRTAPAKRFSGRALAGLFALALVGGIVIGRGAATLDGAPLTTSVSRVAAGVSSSLAKSPAASIQHAV